MSYRITEVAFYSSSEHSMFRREPCSSFADTVQTGQQLLDIMQEWLIMSQSEYFGASAGAGG